MTRSSATEKGRLRAPFFCVRTLATLLCLLAAGDAAAAALRPRLPGIQGTDDRVTLDPTVWPWTALGRVNRDTAGFCTGALVGPDLVLTADHCLYHDRTGRLMAPDRLHFLAGYRRGEYRAHARGRRYVRAPGAPERRSHTMSVATDWAIIVLDKPVAGRPIPVRRLRPAEYPDTGAGALLSSAGYGRDRPHLLSLDDGCPVEPGGGGGVLYHGCDAVPGVSGAPLLLSDDAGVWVVGVISGIVRREGRMRGVAVDASAFLTALRRLLDAADAR